MIKENGSWASPGVREVPFWRDDMQPEEYEQEREYYYRNFELLVKQGNYVPLWKQKDNATGQK